MSSPQTQTTSDLQAVADAIRSNDRFLLVTHENPDGDALGSLLATKLALDTLGKDSVMYLYGDAPLPREYGFMALSGIRRKPPDDAGERVLVALDCANETRMAPDTTLLENAPLTLDIDHHHDNSRFGEVNLVVGDASSTGEVLRDVFAELGVELTPEIAEALYIAVVTDTGRFQYTNTTAEGAAAGGRARRGGRRRPSRLPGRLRVGRVREAEAARPRPRPGAGLRGRAAGRLVPAAQRLHRAERRRGVL